MATATEPKHADHAGYVDFDEYIDFQLTKTRSGIKATDLLTALIGGAAAVLAYVLVFALFDHWVIDGGFGSGSRFVLLSLLIAGLVGWTVWKLVLPYFRQITPLYAASQIEQSQPELKNTLLTLVDLKRAGRPIPESIESALEKRSALNLSHMDVEQAVDRRLLMRLSYVLFALVVLTCGYVLFSPKKLSNSLWRAFLPTSSISAATRTRIDNIEPGDVEVLARAQLNVTADIAGQVPETVTLLFSTADRRFVDEPVTMRQTDEGLQRFGGVITGENGAGILQSLTYRVVAGDAQSDTYAVTVKQPPSATVRDVTYEYPAYMGLSERTQPGGAIDAWEGCWVTLRATANMPLKSAMIKFSDTEDITQKAEEIPAEIVDGVNVTARWQLRIRTDGTYAGFYRIDCRNEAAETDVAPTLHSIKITADKPPQVQLAQPTGDVERPANAIVPLLYAAEDPDFLLRSVILHMELNGDVLPQQPRLYQAPPFRKSVHDVYNLELAKLELAPGDRVTYWLEARDNMEPFADRSGNRANTPKLNITITEPASPEEVQEQLEDDQQQIAEKLDEARQEQGEPGEPSDEQQDSGENTEPPPPNADQPQEPGDEPQPSDASESSDEKNGQSGSGGDQQQQGGDGKSGKGQQQNAGNKGERGGDETSGDQSQQGESQGTGEQPGGEESFDDLLKKLMQRKQQEQQQNPGNEQQPQDGQPEQQSGDQSQQGADGKQPSPGQPSGQSGETGENSGSQGDDATTGQPTGEPGESSTSSPGDAQSGSQPAMNDKPATGEGADPGQPSPPGANPDGTQPKPGDAPGGEPTASDSTQPASDNKPTNDGTKGDGQKQPGDDATGAKPGDSPATENGKPMPGTPEGADPLSDQPGPKPGEPTDNPDAKTGGQPDGPDEPMQGEGDPEGQKSDRPQTGEAGDSQQTSQGNEGGDQKGPGDSTGQKGTQESADQKTGQPGSGKSGEGSQSKPGGSKPGSEGAESSGGKSGGESSGGEKSGGEKGGQKPSGGESGEQPADSDAGGEKSQSGGDQGDKPEMSSDSPSEDQSGEEAGGEKSGGEKGGGEKGGGQKGGGEKGGGEKGGGEKGGGEKGGGEKGGSESGEGQPGEGQGGQPGQGSPGEGGKPGAPPTNGKPGGSGSGTQSDGKGTDAAQPNGQAANGEIADGQDHSGEGADSSIKPEEADLAAKKKAANLVLEELEEQLQRGEIDPALQDELNVTPEQLREFTKKLEQRLAETAGEDISPEAQARRRQFEETLRTIDYDSKGTTREGGEGPREASGGFSGPNRQAPPEYRDAVRRYRERALKRSGGTPSRGANGRGER